MVIFLPSSLLPRLILTIRSSFIPMLIFYLKFCHHWNFCTVLEFFVFSCSFHCSNLIKKLTKLLFIVILLMMSICIKWVFQSVSQFRFFQGITLGIRLYKYFIPFSWEAQLAQFQRINQVGVWWSFLLNYEFLPPRSKLSVCLKRGGMRSQIGGEKRKNVKLVEQINVGIYNMLKVGMLNWSTIEKKMKEC